MFKTLLFHEISKTIHSKRTIWAVSVFLLLFSVIFYIRFEDFKARQQIYIKDISEAQTAIDNAQNYSNINPYAIKPPLVFSIYNEGITHSKGTNIIAKYFTPILGTTKKNSSQNYIYKSAFSMDITFLSVFFLSLLIFITSFDSINGEKEKGTLKMIFTYPVKKSEFILSKIIGSTLFAGMIFAIPYLLSIAVLLTTLPHLAKGSFFITASSYLIFTGIYCFFVSLIGIMLSLSSKYSQKSLVYSLAVWIFLSVIISPLYDVLAESLNNPAEILKLNEQYSEIRNKRVRDRENIEADINPDNVSHMNWQGQYVTNMSVFGSQKTYNAHNKYLKHYYDTYYKEIQREENIKEQIARLKNRKYDLKPYILFFNPATIFNSMSEKITSTGIDSYFNFIRDGIALKEKMTEKGIKEGWLITDAFYNIYDAGSIFPSQDEIAQELYPEIDFTNFDKNKIPPKKLEEMIKAIMAKYYELTSNNKMENNFKAPTDIPKYTYIPLSIGNILNKILGFVIILLFNSLLLFGINIYLFKKYDLR